LNALRLVAPGIVDADAVEVVVLFEIGVPPTAVVDGDPGTVDVDGEAAVVVLVATIVFEVVEVVELDELNAGNAVVADVVEAVTDVDDVDGPIGTVSGAVCACAGREVGLNPRATAIAMTDAIVGNPRLADGMANRTTQSAQKQNREPRHFEPANQRSCVAEVAPIQPGIRTYPCKRLKNV
jgi:hypothetical protein